MVLPADYQFLDVLWTMIIFFCWVAWLWLLILIFPDLFQRDASGRAKAAWDVFVILLPFLGAVRRDAREARTHRPDSQGEGAARQRRDRPSRVERLRRKALAQSQTDR
jgi:hypothetical protein